MQVDEISPAELVADVVNRLCDPGLAAHGAVVGPANDTQQQEGVISMVDSGMPREERYTPVVWVRTQMRCLAGSLATVDSIARGVQRDLHGRVRTIARQASTDQRYLVHLVNVSAGPSMHFDSPETWETLLFAEVMLGTQPIPAS